MKLLLMAVAGAALAGCGSSYPAPTQRMVDAIAAERSAQEVGARGVPNAELQLRRAQEAIANGRMLMDKGEMRRAEFMFVRAKADSEFAIALAREERARVEADQALEKFNTMPAPSTGPGARP